MTPFYTDDAVTLFHGDCLEVLASLPDASVDSVVTDPPYGLGFMGREWDDLPPGVEFAAECLRVLKPGGHMLAFGGSRTWHRLTCAIEDAGFEIRDSIAWLYGSGFPKSLDVSKAIDKAAGVEFTERPAEGVGFMRPDGRDGYNVTKNRLDRAGESTPDAQRWQGWGTALKPAFEPIVVARKPLAGTVAANVLAHGTGALNVDGCRVEMSDADRDVINNMGGYGSEGYVDTTSPAYNTNNPDNPLARTQAKAHAAGRWPSNVVLDDTQAAELDRQSGTRPSGAVKPYADGHENPSSYKFTLDGKTFTKDADSGGASRFFKTVEYDKPAGGDTCDADMGEGFGRCGAPMPCGMHTTQSTSDFPTFRYEPKAPTTERPRDGGTAHPTVKPLDLMRWLVRLVTPPGGTVLDPFAGSGTTAEACIVEGFNCIAIEREADYLPLIVQRLTKPIQVALEFD